LAAGRDRGTAGPRPPALLSYAENGPPARFHGPDTLRAGDRRRCRSRRSDFLRNCRHRDSIRLTMIVTIDGPAGAGKSSTARELARRLSFQFLDTGAMYRAVTWYCLKEEIDLTDEESVAAAARRGRFVFDAGRVVVDGVEVTREIRRSAVTDQTRFVAGNNRVRAQLVELQRHLAEG